jgi:hypothetical protein
MSGRLAGAPGEACAAAGQLLVLLHVVSVAQLLCVALACVTAAGVCSWPWCRPVL